MAKIVNGTVDFNSDSIDGLTVDEVIEEYGDILQISSTSRATVNGEEVSRDYTVGQSDTLVFDQPTGSKGRTVVIRPAA